MAYEITNLIGQSSSAMYIPLKDIFLYFKDKAKFIEDLQENLRKLIVEMSTVYSRKKRTDRLLETSVSKEGSGEYRILVEQIKAFREKYNKFFLKYNKYCGNLPGVIPEPDASIASNVIDLLQEGTPTVWTRKCFKLAKLSKNVKALYDEISRVAERMIPENLILEKRPEVVQVKHDDIDLPSFNEYVKKVLRYLREDKNRSIGIVGSIGVGKTTVMKRLNNQLEGDMSLKFDVVVWINYPKELDTKEKIIEMMQNEIMERLKLKLEKGNSTKQNANIISTILSKEKYIMLIDQVSSTINLDEVGIHKDHKLGKVVVASSDKKVIKQMTDEQVEIERLANDDAWDLFENVCGVIYDPRIKDIADRIIDSCGGLPLVIKLVAKFLKGVKDEKVWSDVKRILQSEAQTAKLLNLAGVGNAYKLVYDGLSESYFKKCLLFGALFPSNHKIYKDYLVECWMAEGFLPLFGTDVPKLRSGRERGATIFRELTDKFLLESCTDNKYIKMPEYFRKVALEQQYPEEKRCVIWAPEENKLLNEEIWRTVTRMSLICCKAKLPKCPESPNISTLLLQCNPHLVKLEDLFFCNMKNLRVLNLNQAKIELLPTSISSLDNLISLYLNGCTRLAKLPSQVKRLEKIEFLDIRGTSIPKLPEEIGNMIQLRSLRVSFAPKECSRNSKRKEVDEILIPPNIICHLQQLEELIIETGCCNPSWDNIADRIARELANLEKLTTLSFHFPTIGVLETFVTNSKSWNNTETHWKNNTFNSFKISIGCCKTQHPYSSEIRRAERQLRFSTSEEISSVKNEEILSVKEVLKQANAFEVVGHVNVKSLSEFDLGNAGALKVCVVEYCNNMVNIVDADSTNDGGVLKCLEELYLFNLRSVQSIWKGLIFPESLSKLEVLTICGCPELTWILDHKLAEALSSLKHLKVKNCPKIVEIIEVEDHIDCFGMLQKVKTVELIDLPNLESICKSGSMMWNSLRKIVAISCQKLTNLPLSNAEELETIECEESWWNALQLSGEAKQCFHPHCHFIVVEEESSSNGRSFNTQAFDNNDSQTSNSRNGHDEAMTSNGSSNTNGAQKVEDDSLYKAKLVRANCQISMPQKTLKSC
ncbi:Apoptotic ATPase [Handroanthus impetiginosus]|uniref:Apoptotic ATPase n=1 Tax=Handroanthus impetiginosus TaxID=429701 RepID=A0A2G9HM93_9LAMI|nr:Apoptotic ATPase [Handroanthus impetiginosus]